MKDCTASAMVDDAAYEALACFEWRLHRGSSGNCYACRSANGKYVHMSNAVMGDPPAGMVWDHKNGNGLDNRRDNLRLATFMQNAQNSRKQRSSRRRRSATTSRFKGVSRTRSGRWAAAIRVNGRATYLGRFQEECAAAQAYDQAARKYHGAFACVNFPRGGERAA